MLLLVVAALASIMPVRADTTIVLGTVERDLTGDGTPEVLRLVGVGQSLDSLDVTFTIASSGEVVSRMSLPPITRTVGFDAGRRELSASEHRAHLDEFADWFFADANFKQPDELVAWMRHGLPGHIPRIPEVIDRDRRRQLVLDSLLRTGHPPAEAERTARSLVGPPGAPSDTARAVATWQEIQSIGVTVFEFSTGGDGVTAIVWSARDQRFYQLLECC